MLCYKIRFRCSIRYTPPYLAETGDTLYNVMVICSNPTPQPVPNPLGGTTVWPQFSWEDMNVLKIQNTSISLVEEWEQKDYAFWTEYVTFIMEGVDWTIPRGMVIMRYCSTQPHNNTYHAVYTP